jgi:hypothetical protein
MNGPDRRQLHVESNRLVEWGIHTLVTLIVANHQLRCLPEGKGIAADAIAERAWH